MLKLICVEASEKCMYPGDEIYISCTFEAMEDYPIKGRCTMFCDLIFGYQTLPEFKPRSFRITGEFYPQPMHLKKGETLKCAMRWHVPEFAYGGTYGINVGICDDDAVPYTFYAGGKTVKRCYAGDIEVAFKNCAPKFVNSHRTPHRFELENASNIIYKTSVDLEFYIRDLKLDTVFVCKEIYDREKFTTDYVDFTLKKIVNGKLTSIILDDVVEKDGYELLCVKLPTLLKGKDAKIISTLGGGRKIDSTNTAELGMEYKFEYNNLGVLQLGEKYIMLEGPYIDDYVHYSVFERNGERYGAVGITLNYRLRKYGDYRSVKVINKPTAVVMETESFVEILNYVRKGKKRPTEFYDRCIFYYFQIECDGCKETYSFLDALERVKKLYYMTGGVKQIMLLRGWQHTGHDTGYPDVFTINKTGGTLETLAYVIEEAKKYNAVITFHDNYDDMYSELPDFDGECIALDMYNEYYKGWIWVSGLSSIISAPRYVKSGKMAERMKKTFEMYPVHTSYHLDVLSCEARRYDFGEDVRMAAQEIIEYKKMIAEEIKSHGFHLTSEAVSSPFAGIVGHVWNIRMRTEEFFPNEEKLPLMGMLYHSIIPASGTFGDPMQIACGAELVPYISGNPEEYYKEIFYLFTLPMGMLYDVHLNDYSKSGTVHTSVYSDGSTVIYNEENNDITVKSPDGYYTKDGNTLVEGFNAGEYLAYTKNGDFSFKAPFNQEIEAALELDFDGKESSIDICKNSDMVTAQLKPGTAFKIILKQA